MPGLLKIAYVYVKLSCYRSIRPKCNTISYLYSTIALFPFFLVSWLYCILDIMLYWLFYHC